MALAEELKESNHLPDVAVFLRYLGGGGADQMMLHLAQGFHQSGLRVDLVLGSAWGPHLWKVPKGVRLVDLKASNTAKTAVKLVQYLTRDRPQALLSTLHYTNELALIAKRFPGVNTRVVVREANTPSEEAKRTATFKKRLTPWLIRMLYPSADGIVAVADGVAQDIAQLTHLSEEHIQVIFNPTVTPQLKAKAKAPLDHPWFAPGQPPVVLGVGKLEKQKDFPTLIKAFAQVRSQRPSRLIILGWGPDRPALEALIQSLDLEADVSLPDYAKNPYAYMARASAFVLSSAWEGLPNVLIEAMATGVPVIATNCKSGPAEILDRGKYGHLVPVGDVQAMADAILAVLSGQGRSVDENWLRQFSLETSAQKYIKMLGLTPLNRVLRSPQ